MRQTGRLKSSIRLKKTKMPAGCTSGTFFCYLLFFFFFFFQITFLLPLYFISTYRQEKVVSTAKRLGIRASLLGLAVVTCPQRVALALLIVLFINFLVTSGGLLECFAVIADEAVFFLRFKILKTSQPLFHVILTSCIFYRNSKKISWVGWNIYSLFLIRWQMQIF